MMIDEAMLRYILSLAVVLPIFLFNNANNHGRSQSVQLYATSATISGIKFGPETHIAAPIHVVTQVFHHLSKGQSYPLGWRLF